MVFMGYGQIISELEIGGGDFLRHFKDFGVAVGTKQTLLCAARSPWGSLELIAGPAVLRKSNLRFFKSAPFRSRSIAVKLPVNTSNTSH